METFDRDRLARLGEALGLAFYPLMLIAFIAAVSGSAGTGFFFLLLGALAHVGRCGLEEFVGRAGG